MPGRCGEEFCAWEVVGRSFMPGRWWGGVLSLGGGGEEFCVVGRSFVWWGRSFVSAERMGEPGNYLLELDLFNHACVHRWSCVHRWRCLRAGSHMHTSLCDSESITSSLIVKV